MNSANTPIDENPAAVVVGIEKAMVNTDKSSPARNRIIAIFPLEKRFFFQIVEETLGGGK